MDRHARTEKRWTKHQEEHSVVGESAIDNGYSSYSIPSRVSHQFARWKCKISQTVGRSESVPSIRWCLKLQWENHAYAYDVSRTFFALRHGSLA